MAAPNGRSFAGSPAHRDKSKKRHALTRAIYSTAVNHPKSHAILTGAQTRFAGECTWPHGNRTPAAGSLFRGRHRQWKRSP